MSSISPISSQSPNVSQSQQTGQTSAVKSHHHHKSQQAPDTQSSSSSSSSSSPQDILELGTQNTSSKPVTYSKPANPAQTTQPSIPE